MSSFLRKSINRRSLMLGAPLLLAGGLHQHKRNNVSAETIVTGDCSLEPTLQYVFDFSTGNYTALPLMRMGSLDPDIDWVFSQSPELGGILTPPGWGVFNGWANEFDRNGIPQWQPKQPGFPFWATTMVVAPDESAAYIYILGQLDNVDLAPADGAQLARDLVMGPGARHKSLCLAEDEAPSYDMSMKYWVTGDRFGSDLLISRGTVITSSVAGPSLGPGSTFLFDAFLTPRNQAEDLVLDVYLRMLYQQLPKGGGGNPTPTPTPTP